MKKTILFLTFLLSFLSVSAQTAQQKALAELHDEDGFKSEQTNKDNTFTVYKGGKAYEITFWLKVNATGVNVQIKDGDTSGANIAGDWVDMNKAGDWKQFTYIVRPTSDLLTINFCGSGSAAEDAYVDTFTVTELIGEENLMVGETYYRAP